LRSKNPDFGVEKVEKKSISATFRDLAEEVTKSDDFGDLVEGSEKVDEKDEK